MKGFFGGGARGHNRRHEHERKKGSNVKRRPGWYEMDRLFKNMENHVGSSFGRVWGGEDKTSWKKKIGKGGRLAGGRGWQGRAPLEEYPLDKQWEVGISEKKGEPLF